MIGHNFKRFRNVIRYIILMALDIAVMVIFHSYLNLLILVAMIFFPILSILALKNAPDKLDLELKLPGDSMVLKETFHVRIRLKSKVLIPLVNATVNITVENPFAREYGFHKLNIPVRMLRDTEVLYPIEMEHCGRFLIKAEDIMLTDLLGIFDVTKKCSEVAECLIAPSSVPLKSEAGTLYNSGVSESVESRQKGYDFSEITGIREYIPGDKLQNIHWKLSTKKDKLMVKERVSVSAMQLSVLVEIEGTNDDRLDEILKLADGITSALVLMNLPYTIYYYSTLRGEVVETYIGGETDRNAWLSGVLYDKSYDGEMIIDMFKRQYGSDLKCLYIGTDLDVTSDVDAIIGEHGAVAVLL